MPWLAGRALPPPRVVRLRARWGSCAADGRITLNLGLVLLEQPLIDYVLLHELCHLREMNHGPRFYALLAAALPDHRERQAALRAGAPVAAGAGLIRTKRPVRDAHRLCYKTARPARLAPLARGAEQPRRAPPWAGPPA